PAFAGFDRAGADDGLSHQHVFSQEVFYFERRLSGEQLRRIGEELLGNALVNHLEHGERLERLTYVPEVHIAADARTETISLEVSDPELLHISRDRVLSLTLEEMRSIRDHFRAPQHRERRRAMGLPESAPTDCELEVVAQTWSEHCKHKEFNALIRYRDLDTGEERTIDSLFKSFIRASTEEIGRRLLSHCSAGEGSWLVKVFTDNAGVVRLDEKRVFVFKVETHNSPSALDPYGGALTGILGVNRDPLGTGRGGGRLLFNTDVLCFGPPDYAKPLLPGQLHPLRVFAGVRKGIEDGGNKSGIPTVGGAIVFDERFAGKPLVFCGTGGVMSAEYQGLPSWEKAILPGDVIVMAGGRVGKDGIHGATFSSAEIDARSPRSAVQIGSPITQKLLADFLERACEQGLVRCTTDDGAGGLSSSIGELATLSGGAQVELEQVPLKYAGLKPWEICVSESQERMTLAVAEEKVAPLFALAGELEVELSRIGRFTDTGMLEVRYQGKPVASLDLGFLHDGVPRKTLEAEWRRPRLTEPRIAIQDHGEALLRLLGSLDICSREPVIRQYDHEVKGRTIVKPLMGRRGQAPQDAAVMRLDFDSWAGLAISHGIAPRYGDLDAYEMSAGAFDEAVRQIVAVGGRLPEPSRPFGFWCANDNFCVPDSVFDPVGNPDGKYKLAQLVRMCQALYDLALFFGVPMTSGKDSMKNDLRAGGVKISVPPTVLYSMVARLDDVRRVVTSELKAEGDLLYLVGRTYDELGGSQLYRLFGELGANVPRVRKEEAKARYLRMGEAHERGLLESCHDLSDGGRAVALAEASFGGVGFEVRLPRADLSATVQLYSESHSRFVVSVRPENRAALEALFGADATCLGTAGGDRLRIQAHGARL
ncbi:MAG: phosphoribosylformylglycinamidine synthase, partial [Deltaproteobacteria bacterium]|nr:phosphoribosylformylglycinamidine synthase [Deltaproteobacteria bacterium]